MSLKNLKNTIETKVSDFCLLMMGMPRDVDTDAKLVKTIIVLNGVCSDVFKAMGTARKFTVKLIGGEADQNRFGRDGSRYGA